MKPELTNHAAALVKKLDISVSRREGTAGQKKSTDFGPTRRAATSHVSTPSNIRRASRARKAEVQQKYKWDL